MQNNNEVKTSLLRIAQLRYFDTKNNGVAVPSINAYVFLVKIDNSYYNLFNPSMRLPVYDRVPYSNTTLDGVPHGSKITLVDGVCEDGFCYVLERISLEKELKVKQVPISVIKDYMFDSSLFFIDRILLYDKINKFKYAKKFFSDVKLEKEFMKEFESYNKDIQYYRQMR